MMTTNIAVAAFLLPYFFDFAASIRCYDCNSQNTSMCLDPTIYDQETLDMYLRSTDCDSGVLNTGNSRFFCRKITQSILHKGRDSELRVTRGCGWVRHHKECYKADNEDHLETVCQCFSDHCNHAATLDQGLMLIAAVASLQIMYQSVL